MRSRNDDTRPYRLWLRGLIALLAAASLASACGGDDLTIGVPEPPVCASGGPDSDTLILFNWPDYLPEEVIRKFEDRYAVTVEQRTYESNEEMLSQVQARAADFDVIVPSDYMVDIMRRDGLLLPLDPIALPGRINLDPLFDERPFDPEGEYSVPYLWGTVGIGVNVNVVGDDQEPSWSLIFDESVVERFAGRVSLLDDPRQTMAAALMYLGLSPNSESREEIRAAADLIAAVRSNLAAFQSEDYARDLADGALDVAHGRSDVFFGAFESDSNDYRYLIPGEGAVAWVDNLAIPITAAHPCTAHAFIDFLLEPRHAADLANFTGHASPNLEARQFIDIELLADPAIYPPDEVRATLEFLVDTDDAAFVYVEEFARAQTP